MHSFGSIGHFKKSRKPVQAGAVKNCPDCSYEPDCIWSAKRTYLDRLSQPGMQWASLFIDADVLDIENANEALRTTSYGNCVY